MGRRPKPSTGSPRVLRACPLSELSADSEADMGEAMGEGMTDGTDANKANAIAFYELMFNRNQPRAAIDRYAGAEYRQHNPGVARPSPGAPSFPAAGPTSEVGWTGFEDARLLDN
jgi:hypothetical protein